MLPDIFFTPEYVDLFKDTEFGGSPQCFRSSGIEYRFYLRRINGINYYDIVSVYGYSGPVAIIEPQSRNFSIYYFLEDFHNYCLKNNIIAEFARLHPFIHNERLLCDGVVQSGEVVYLDLTQSEEQIWKGMDSSCRNHITKANRTATRSPESFSPKEFYEVYSKTMERRQAAKGYFFPPEFFEKLAELPGVTLGTFYDKKIVGAKCVLLYGDYAHDFLTGTDLTVSNLNANNLLMWESIRWAKWHGAKIYNVGGTLAGDQGLLNFKKSFSKLTMPFFTYRKTHNQKVYDELCKVKKVDPNSTQYYPAYRSK